MSVLNCSDDGKLPAMFGRRKPIAPTSFTAPRRLSTKPVASNPQVRGTTRSLHWMTVLLALLASLIFVLADADQRRSAANIWMQITIEVTAALGLTWLVRRRMALTNDKPLIIPLLLIVVLLSVLWEPFQRWFFQTGRSFETMVMNSQKALMLAAAVFGYLVSYQRLSIGIGVALAIFSTAICQEHRVHWLIAIYGFAVVSWMIASHWDTLQSRLIGGETRRLPLRWLILGPSIPLLLVLASADGGNRAIIAMRGYLPGSGGDGESDPYSRSGVNAWRSRNTSAENFRRCENQRRPITRKSTTWKAEHCCTLLAEFRCICGWKRMTSSTVATGSPRP